MVRRLGDYVEPAFGPAYDVGGVEDRRAAGLVAEGAVLLAAVPVTLEGRLPEALPIGGVVVVTACATGGRPRPIVPPGATGTPYRMRSR